MSQSIRLQGSSTPLDQILRAIPRLSQAELLELIAYLARRAQKTAVSEPSPLYKWSDMAGVAPDLLEGQDAQTWVNQVRTEEWERDILS